MVDDFKERHRTGAVGLEEVRGFIRFSSHLAGCYNRFSCDNSSAHSIIDQMTNSLAKAKSENRFIPWAYVFADYSVSGLNPARQGYSSYKAVLGDEDQPIDTTYIDDFTRASRDELEWWKLAHSSKRLGKRMVGASDGFDLNSPNADIMITMYGLVSRLFIKGLRQKVRRGMKGAVSRGTCVGKVPLGFTRRICRDANGEVVRRPDGRPRHEPCIDPVTQPHRLEMYELYVHKNWSPYKIARHFNQQRVDGSNSWTASSIKKLLKGTDAIGIFVWNRQRREYDYELEKYVKVQNPRSEWEIYKDPDLAIVPKELWRAAWLKLLRIRKAHPLTGRKWTRNQKSASTLFSGTLFCEHCGTELQLARSAGKYKVMSCRAGSLGAKDCALTTSKSTQIIEDCLLGHIGDHLLSEEVIANLVERANGYLEEEASKPRVDAEPMKAKVRNYQGRIKKLVKQVEQEPDGTLCDGYHTRIKELQKEVHDLKRMIREAEVHNQPPPAPLDVERAKVYLADLRELLHQEIPMAAEAIRALTGPIRIRQEKIPGKRGARWIAKFSPDLVALLRKVAKDKGYCDVPTLTAIPSETQSVEVVIEKVPKYERLAPKFKQLHDNGASIQTIAAAHQISWAYAQQILAFAETGKRPSWGPSKKGGKGRSKAAKYKDISPDVVRMHDDEKLSFERIAAALHVGVSTVCRAYDYGHPELSRQAVAAGMTPNRRRCSELGEEKKREVRKQLRLGMRVQEIAKRFGCGRSTIYLIRKQMETEAAGDKAS